MKRMLDDATLACHPGTKRQIPSYGGMSRKAVELIELALVGGEDNLITHHVL